MIRRRMTALVAGVSLVAALSGAAALAVAAPSSATSDEASVALSVDGRAWSQELRMPLLDPDQVWVPGDVERTSLLVRHDGAGEARGTVTVSVDGQRELAQAIDVRVRAGQEPWHAGGSAPVVVGPDDELPVELEVVFAPAAGDATQGGNVRLDVAVVLAGDDAALVPPGFSDGLPRTGGDMWLLVLAVAAIVAGLAVRGGLPRREATDG